MPLKKLFLDVIPDVLSRNHEIKVSAEKKYHENLGKRGREIFQTGTAGSEEEVVLNRILNAEWEFVALFCRSRELLKVSEQKGDVIKKFVS